MHQPQPRFPPSPDVCIPVLSLCPGLWDLGKLAPPPSTSHYLKRDYSIFFHPHNGKKKLPHGKAVWPGSSSALVPRLLLATAHLTSELFVLLSLSTY